MVVSCQPYAPATFTSWKYSWYSFLSRGWVDRRATGHRIRENRNYINAYYRTMRITFMISYYIATIIQCVPLATEPGISLIIVTPVKKLQRSLNRNTFVVWEMKRNVSVVRFKFRCNILISGQMIKEMPGSVASGTPCMIASRHWIGNHLAGNN